MTDESYDVGGGVFSMRERRYLESLPAVRRVVGRRIYYTDSFKRECIRRYRQGESPQMIFNDAGLWSHLIGYKRIERCIARWKRSVKMGEEGDVVGGGVSGDGAVRVEPVGISENSGRGGDIRDLMLAQQACRIAALEQEIRRLNTCLGELSRS